MGADVEPMARVMRDMDIAATASALPETPELLPGPFVNFDFLWSIDAVVRPTIGETSDLVEALMRCLRPGGLAVHVLPFVPSVEQRGGVDRPGALMRKDVERLALTLISRNIETAQLKIACDDPLLGDTASGISAVSAFGLVFRRPPLTAA